jgi:hypothetical protein
MNSRYGHDDVNLWHWQASQDGSSAEICQDLDTPEGLRRNSITTVGHENSR